MTRTPPNPSGLCQCGCGRETPLAKTKGHGLVIGEHVRYILGHQPRNPKRVVLPPPNPSGFCKCGCGEKTPLAREGNRKKGWVAGEHILFLPSHSGRARNHTIYRVWNRYSYRWFITDRRGKTVAWARVVMEGQLCRDLLPGEVVHHINGDSEDDRVENLKVFRSQRDHLLEEWHAPDSQYGRLKKGA